jgi:N-acetylmuramoyl-L-alanine amidase
VARPSRFKRKLLAELVADNVAVARGELPTASRSHRRERDGRGVLHALAGAAVVVVTLLVGAALVAATGLPVTWTDVTRPEPAVPAVPEATEASAAPRAVPADAATAADRQFSAPRRVDSRALPLEIRTIVVDPGHGGAQPGAEGPLGLLEKEVALDVALRLKELLDEAGFRVLMTREDDVAVSLAERAAVANEAEADLFVSIHLNWIENPGVRGVETYYLGPTEDPYLTALAAEENRGSGLPLSELRPLLDDIYLDVRSDASERLARAVQRSLHRSLARVNPELTDRGVKTAPFIVLAKTDMPAILAEVSCLSNRDEAELLTKPHYRNYIAEALFDGLFRYAGSPGEASFQLGRNDRP